MDSTFIVARAVSPLRSVDGNYRCHVMAVSGRQVTIEPHVLCQDGGSEKDKRYAQTARRKLMDTLSINCESTAEWKTMVDLAATMCGVNTRAWFGLGREALTANYEPPERVVWQTKLVQEA